MANDNSDAILQSAELRALVIVSLDLERKLPRHPLRKDLSDGVVNLPTQSITHAGLFKIRNAGLSNQDADTEAGGKRYHHRRHGVVLHELHGALHRVLKV